MVAVTGAPPTATELLARSLGAALDVWLCLTCQECPVPRWVAMPCRLLAQRYGGGVTVAEAIGRLRCSECGGRRVSVEATDDPAAGAHGGKPGTWRVVLVGCW